jgi:hypothetical protein
VLYIGCCVGKLKSEMYRFLCGILRVSEEAMPTPLYVVRRGRAQRSTSSTDPHFLINQ